MPRSARPVRSSSEERKRARRIFARKPSAAHAFVRILDHLNRLAPDRLRLPRLGLRVGDEVDKMEERLDRLNAAREVLSLRQAATTAKAPHENRAKRNRPQALEKTRNGETADSAMPMISGT